MQSLKTKQKSKVEFNVGDKVQIGNMFFRNHGLKIQDMKGTIKYIVPAWDSPIPTVKVIFDFDPSFFQMASNGYVKVETKKEDNKFVMMVTIKIMYLEKVK